MGIKHWLQLSLVVLTGAALAGCGGGPQRTGGLASTGNTGAPAPLGMARSNTQMPPPNFPTGNLNAGGLAGQAMPGATPALQTGAGAFPPANPGAAGRMTGAAPAGLPGSVTTTNSFGAGNFPAVPTPGPGTFGTGAPTTPPGPAPTGFPPPTTGPTGFPAPGSPTGFPQ
jgi:hypothetical protein